ncbi:MAG: hypothetical protein QN187_08655 [Armatimonadota bacterium]|nr:hypothetical protein [Armatimonadota bacterium]
MREPGEPLVVEVMAPNLTGRGYFRLRDGRAAPPGEADPGTERAYRLLRLLDQLRERFGARIAVHLIEPLSFAWIARVVRFRPRRYPLFIVGGRMAIAGLDEEAIARTVAGLLPSAGAAPERGEEAPG